MTIERLFERINEYLCDESHTTSIVVADVGNALFGASDLLIRHRTEFLGPAYYASMGFAVPAALGAQMIMKGTGRATTQPRTSKRFRP